MDLATLPGTPVSSHRTETITFQQERIAEIYPEMADLLIRQWNELALYKDIKINPDMGTFLSREAAGSCVLLTVRVDKEVIGYIVYLIGINLQYRFPEAHMVLYFLHPKHRKSGIGLKLFRFGEEEMSKRGVKVLWAHTKMDPKLNHGRIFEYLGYDCQHVVYTKRLDRV